MDAETEPSNAASEALTERQAVEEKSSDCGTVENLLLLPDPEIKADSLDNLVERINESVKDAGYSLVVNSTWKSTRSTLEDDRARIICTKIEAHRGESDETIRKRRKVDEELDEYECPMHLHARRNDRSGQWSYTYGDMYHNHGGLSDPAVFGSHGPVSSEEMTEVANCYAAGIEPQKTLRLMKARNESCTLVLQDIYNYEIFLKQKDSGSNVVADTDDMESKSGQPNVAEALLDILKQSADGGSEYFWRVAFDSKGRVENLFLAKKTQIEVYRAYPDILVLDSTQKRNQYEMPVLNFVGCTGAKSETHIALAFLGSENTDSYEWALSALKEMNTESRIKHPAVCFLDRNRDLKLAVESRLPNCPMLLSLDKIHDKVSSFARRSGLPLHLYPDTDKSKPTHAYFMSAYEACVCATTESALDTAFQWMSSLHPQIAGDIENYYFDSWRRQISAIYREKMLSFGFKASSPGERAHNALKTWVQAYTPDVDDLWSKMNSAWSRQYKEYTRTTLLANGPVVVGSIAWDVVQDQKNNKSNYLWTEGKSTVVPWSQKEEEYKKSHLSAEPPANIAQNAAFSRRLQNDKPKVLQKVKNVNRFWAKVSGHIHAWPLQQALSEYGKREDRSVCNGVYTATHGIPCRHLIGQLRNRKMCLELDDFHSHWHIHRDVPWDRPGLGVYRASPSHEEEKAVADDSDTSIY